MIPPSIPRFDQLFFHLIIDQKHTWWVLLGRLFSHPQGERQKCHVFQSVVDELVETFVKDAEKGKLRVWRDWPSPDGSCAKVKQLPFRSKCQGSVWIISHERARRLGLRTNVTSRPIVSILTASGNSIWVQVALSW